MAAWIASPVAACGVRVLCLVGEGEDRGTTWCFLVGHAKVQTATQLLQICSGLRENDSLECSADRQGASLDDKSRQIWSGHYNPDIF